MINWLPHLPILPVAVPLFAGAALLLLKDSQRKTRVGLVLISVLIQLAVAIKLLFVTAGSEPALWPQAIAVYLLGDWPAPFGIVMVVDRLAAIMLTLSAVLGLTTLVYSMARWDRAGIHFHSLFQFLLMGLNGAFLTGDLFNLFVFFEVLLAASYGLMLHGSGEMRVSAGLHYIATNLIASFMLLIAIALIYGVTGTLNMADLAVQAGKLAGPDRKLFEAAAAILGMAFLIKAGAWPLNFWLPPAYANACAPVAAVFAIMTKVGIYALLRLGSLLLPTGAPGRLWRRMDVSCRTSHSGLRYGRDACGATDRPAGRILRHRFFRHLACCLRNARRYLNWACTLLFGQFCIGDRRLLHADRND